MERYHAPVTPFCVWDQERKKIMKEELTNAIAEVREEDALRLTQAMLDEGENPRTVLDICRTGMGMVGDRYEKGEYFLPELIIAGDILRGITELLRPQLEADAESEEPRGVVVIGTVEGDIHDVGKDIVSFMLDANNFKVHDLGIDVSSETFVEKIQEVEADILALSGFLTLAFDQMKDTVKAIQEAGYRDKVKVMIGGAPMDEQVCGYIGADAFGRDATAAVKIAKEWTE